MKWTVLFLFIFTFIKADEIPKIKDELYITVYLHSFHWTRNESTGEKYNNTHKAFGIEYINAKHYSLSYNHFINSRGKDVDVYGAGYLLHFNDSSGLHLIGGYQEGYCFNGLLNSIECTEGSNNKSAFLLPLIYYKHEYFKLDLFTNSDMLALRFNIKITDLF